MPLATPPMGLSLTKSVTLHIKLEDELTALLSLTNGMHGTSILLEDFALNTFP